MNRVTPLRAPVAVVGADHHFDCRVAVGIRACSGDVTPCPQSSALAGALRLDRQAIDGAGRDAIAYSDRPWLALAALAPEAPHQLIDKGKPFKGYRQSGRGRAHLWNSEDLAPFVNSWVERSRQPDQRSDPTEDMRRTSA